MFGPTGNLRELSAVIAASSGDWKCQRCGSNILAGGVRTTCPDCAALVTFLMHGRSMRTGFGTIDGPASFDTIRGCEFAFHLVFLEVVSRHGLERALQIIKKFRPPSDSRKAEIKIEAMLDATDIMTADGEDEDGSRKEGYSIAQIARWRAEHNKTLPADEQRGPGGTDVQNLDHYIRRQIRERENRQNKAQNKALLDHVDRMRRKGRSIREVARQCASQNAVDLLPELQHGPGDTDPDRLNLYIRRLLKERERGRKASPPKR
jgi:hypothetical protein